MPQYEYVCNDCQINLEKLLKIRERDSIIECPNCSSPMSRSMSSSTLTTNKSISEKSIAIPKDSTSIKKPSAVFEICGANGGEISNILFTTHNPSENSSRKYPAIGRNPSAKIKVIGDDSGKSYLRMNDVQLENFDTAISAENTSVEGENVSFKDVKNAIEYKTRKEA